MTPKPTPHRTIPCFVDRRTGLTLDVSGMELPAAALDALVGGRRPPAQSPLAQAHAEMQRLERGEIKNPDEGRKVTHFSDRVVYTDSELFRDVESFAAAVRSGDVRVSANRVENVVVNGIGGSALGPQLLQFAINGPYWNELSPGARGDGARMYFLDNTDSAGLADVLAAVDLGRALVITISKSGGTRETRNNMIALEQAYAARELTFAGHAAAVTMHDSALDVYAREHGWLKRFPMADSIGGRTSETNIVGHVPAALAGIDFAAFVGGARHMDELTRAPGLANNPAYQLAVAWFVAGNGRGDRNMVIVPYSDRLVLLGRYLQQLVMESLGKERDLAGNVVHQGLTVYGNKGGTDAHAYIQQLNDGRDDFFVTFVEVLRDTAPVFVDEELTMGDYLHAFKDGLVKALRRKQRRVIEVVLERLDEFGLGMLIALYERAVAVYAELIHINAFHQPGVQAYKTASAEVNQLSEALRRWLVTPAADGWSGTAGDLAVELDEADRTREVAGLLAKYAVNERSFGRRSVRRVLRDRDWLYSIVG